MKLEEEMIEKEKRKSEGRSKKTGKNMVGNFRQKLNFRPWI